MPSRYRIVLYHVENTVEVWYGDIRLPVAAATVNDSLTAAVFTITNPIIEYRQSEDMREFLAQGEDNAD